MQPTNPNQFTEKAWEAIAHSQLIWLKDCGHVPHLEQPQMTAKYILEFRQDESPQN